MLNSIMDRCLEGTIGGKRVLPLPTEEKSYTLMTSVIPEKSLIIYLYGRPVGEYPENATQNQVLSN